MDVASKITVIFFLAITGITMPCQLLEAQESSSDVEYSLVYLIHGDGDYLYHTSEGEARQADEKVLQEANSIGRRATRGEVMIFHIRPEKKILGIFSKKDRRFLHYRNGKLITKDNYSPRPDTSLNPFGTETAIFLKQQYKTQNSEDIFRGFLYFGHEIPVGPHRGYHASQANIVFNRERFVEGLKIFSHNGTQKFDLSVISTCENGTPAMAALLQPYTNTLIASPQNLHLSHIDTQRLLMLETEPDLPPDSLGRAVAKETYRRLSESVQTVVSLSVFQTERMGSDLMHLSDEYFVHRSSQDSTDIKSANIDCAELPFFQPVKNSHNITSYYRPPKFGLNSKKKEHSGWGCRIEN